MDINTIRKIDYYAGIIICFILTVFNKAAKIFGIAKKPKKYPKNMLFIELSEMGSTVLAYPAMKKIKDLYPDSKLYFLIFKKNKPSVEILKIIEKENIITIRDNSFFALILDTIKAILKLRKRKIDTSFDLELFSRFSNILSYLSGANNRIGFNNYYAEGLYRGDLQTHKIYYNTHQHISMNFLSMIYSLETNIRDRPLLKKEIDKKDIQLPQLPLTKEKQTNIWNILKSINPAISRKNKLVIINPNAGDILPIRAWPIQNYIELIKKLLEDKKTFIIITGTKCAKSDAELITREVANNRCINLVEKTKFGELIDLFNISNLLITNDSGPGHFASLTPIKTIVFFGPETPNLYKPIGKNVTVFYKQLACSPCLTAFNHRHSPCKNNKCLKAIKVDEVYQTAKKLIK